MPVTVQLTTENLASKQIWKRSHDANHSGSVDYGPLYSTSQTERMALPPHADLPCPTSQEKNTTAKLRMQHECKGLSKLQITLHQVDDAI